MFDAIKSAAGGDLTSQQERPFELMLKIDREAAAAELLTDGWLRADQPKLRHVLEALNKEGVLVDEARLYALEQGLRERHAEYPHSDAYQQVLLALALKRASEARARIEAAAGFGDPGSRCTRRTRSPP